jgi:PIN domain nuclease of toxin-antitoxin system
VKLLLDTHFAIELCEDYSAGMAEPSILEAALHAGELYVSVVSLWEVAIKSRLGKLQLLLSPDRWPEAFAVAKLPVLNISVSHVLADIGPRPMTKDPFDLLLLGICAAENMQLVTKDRALNGHPLAWRPFLS